MQSSNTPGISSTRGPAPQRLGKLLRGDLAVRKEHGGFEKVLQVGPVECGRGGSVAGGSAYGQETVDLLSSWRND